MVFANWWCTLVLWKIKVDWGDQVTVVNKLLKYDECLICWSKEEILELEWSNSWTKMGVRKNKEATYCICARVSRAL